MAALILALSFALQTQGTMPWPLGNGTNAYGLRGTYGQFDGTILATGLHYGIDVIAGVTGEEVRALEAGTVRKVKRDDDYRSALVIESTSQPGRAILYVHLDKTSVQLRSGDPVVARQLIGKVVAHDPFTGIAHVHVSRLSWKPGDRYQRWSGLDRRLGVQNPLLLLQDLDDHVAPVIESIEVTVAGSALPTAKVAVRTDDYTGASPQYQDCAQVSPPGAYDVIVSTYDRDGRSSQHLAPYEIVLTTEHGGTTVENRLRLDGPLKEIVAEDVYNTDGILASIGNATASTPYRYFFVLSNCGSTPAAENAWSATQLGDHRLHITVRDAAGNTSTADQVVTVK